MAQKIQTLFIDDLDASAAEGTIRFGLDGTEYEIDLNAGHARSCGTRWPGMWVLAAGSAAAPASPPAAAGAGRPAAWTLPGSVSGPGPRASRSKTAAGCPRT